MSDTRLALPFALGGVICLILAVVVSITESPTRRVQSAVQRVAIDAARVRAEKYAGRLATQISPTLAAGNSRQLQLDVQLAASVSPDLIEIGVVDADQTVLASSDSERVAKPAPAPIVQAVSVSQTDGGAHVAEDLGAQRLVVAVPIGKQQRLATLYMVQSTAALEDDLSRAVEIKPARVPVWLTVGGGGIGLLIALSMLILADRRRYPQTMRVQEVVEQMVHGHFQVRLDPQEVPLFGGVAERLNLVADQVSQLQQAQAEGRRHASRMAEELQNAQVVQQTLMPDVRRIGRGPLQLCGVYRSMSKLSGDWWSYYMLDEHRTMVVLADVLGHGIGAAVVGAMAYGCAAQLHQQMGGTLRPEYLLQQLNRVIWMTTKGKYTMSCFAAIIDTRECQLTYSSGAHAFPLLFRSRDAQKPFFPLVAAGAPLGSTETPEFQQSSQAFQPGDLLICYTDGLIEAANAQGDPFGDKRVRQAVQRCYKRNVEEICEIILNEVSRYVGSAEQDDDQTLVVARNLALPSSVSPSLITHPSQES